MNPSEKKHLQSMINENNVVDQTNNIRQLKSSTQQWTNFRITGTKRSWKVYNF